MVHNKYVAVVCAAILGISSSTLVACSNNNDVPSESDSISADQTESSENRSEEPSTPEAVVDAYKLANDTMLYGLKIDDLDEDTLARIFSIYYAAFAQWNAAYADVIVETQGKDLDALAYPDFSLGDFIPDNDRLFLDEIYEDIGLDQRILVNDEIAHAKYDLFYFMLAISLSGDDSIIEETAYTVNNLSTDAVTMNDDNTARISLPASDIGYETEDEAVLKRDAGVWKLSMGEAEAFEVATFGLFILDRLLSEVEGVTPEQKGRFMAAKVREGLNNKVGNEDDIIDDEAHSQR